MFNIKEEVSAVLSNDLLDSLLFYGSEYPEHREEIFKEFEKQTAILIKEVKEGLDEQDVEEEE